LASWIFSSQLKSKICLNEHLLSTSRSGWNLEKASKSRWCISKMEPYLLNWKTTAPEGFLKKKMSQNFFWAKLLCWNIVTKKADYVMNKLVLWYPWSCNKPDISYQKLKISQCKVLHVRAEIWNKLQKVVDASQKWSLTC